MNSETKLTLEQLNTICKRQGIELKSHFRLTAGFSHELHRINEDLVLKLYNPNNPRSYQTELTLLVSNLPFKKPALVANSQRDNEIDRNYIIMTYVPGNSLGSVWHLATETQREELIKEICQSLKTINKIPLSVLIEASVTSWEEKTTKTFENILNKLKIKSIIDDVTSKKAQSFFL